MWKSTLLNDGKILDHDIFSVLLWVKYISLKFGIIKIKFPVSPNKTHYSVHMQFLSVCPLVHVLWYNAIHPIILYSPSLCFLMASSLVLKLLTCWKRGIVVYDEVQVVIQCNYKAAFAVNFPLFFDQLNFRLFRACYLCTVNMQ